MFGLIDSAVLSLVPVYGLRKGLDTDMAAALLSVFVTGAFVAQIPLGWLTDHVEPRRVMVGLTALTLAMLVVIPFTVTDRVLVYPVLALLGAGLGSFYTVSLSAMGRRFRGGALVGVTTSFMFLWALGSLIGPAVSGLAIELAGPDGMPVAAAVLCLAFLVLLVARGREARTDVAAS
jgi:MFS family permease